MKKILFICSLLLLLPNMAFAHAYLIESSPEEAAELAEPPSRVTLQFLGFLEPVFSKIEVFDNAERKVSEKTQFSDNEDGTRMEAPLKKGLPSGMYTVKWKCISKDGHNQSETYTFTIK